MFRNYILFVVYRLLFNLMDSPIYNVQGKKSGSIELPESVFGVAWNDALMYQVVTAMQGNARTPVAHVKTRGDVRGGGRKPWQQKGTGRARHGSIRSPIWRGGGVTHGPRNDKSYTRTIPKKMRAKALAMTLSQKFKDGRVVFVDSFAFEAPKTAVAKKMLMSLGKALGLSNLADKRGSRALVALSEPRVAATKSFRNLGNVECRSVRDLNPMSVLQYAYLVIENPDAAVAILSHRIAGKDVAVKKVAKKEKHVKSDMKAVHAAEKGDQ